jgi:simple sugar transport system substrate-binding protein
VKKLCIFILIFTAFLLIGCEAEQETSEPLGYVVFGFSQLGDESEFRTAHSRNIRNAAESADIQLIFENAQQQQFNQIKAIRSFILKGVDVIAFSPIVEEGWDNVLIEAREAGIPVIVVDRKIRTDDPTLYTAFIGSDFYREGVMAGEFIVNRFSGGEETVRIAEISGTLNSSPMIGRYEGVRSAFTHDPRFEIVTSVSGDFMRSRGRECMEAILQETEDIDVLFAHNDDMALGAIEILEEHGIIPGVDIIIVSVDAQTSGLEALRQGRINCLVELTPYIGDTLMELALAIVNGEPFERYTYTETRVFTDRDNFDDLPDR